MKHWKFRATAIIIVIAALLSGTLGLVNDETAVKDSGSPLLRVISAFTRSGAAPAPSPAATGDPDAKAAPVPTAVAAPTGGSIIPSGQVNIAISGGDDPDAPTASPPAGVSPNQRIPKDYHVDNTGSADVYVFIAVTVPYVNVATQLADGTYQPPASRPLYSFRANAGWALLEDRVVDGKATYVYAYAESSAGPMTGLKPGQSTGRLFDELITLNYVEGRLDGSQAEVVAQAYAIQAENLGEDVDTPEAVWALVKNDAASRDALN